MNSALPDDITAFLGTIPPDEYEQRRRLRTARNAATFKASETSSGDVRALCWIVTERASEWIYAPADTAALSDVVKLCKLMLKAADNIETLEARHYG